MGRLAGFISCILLRRAILSGRSSLRSMYSPLEAFSTTFPGIGGSAVEIIKG